MKRALFLTWILVLVGLQACATSQPSVMLSEDPEVNAFLEQIKHHLEANDWSKILDVADPTHFETQVQDMGMAKVQYAAELFGLYMVDNSIQTGETLTWEDLERIRTVELNELTGSGETLQVSGTVTLSTQEVLNLNFEIVKKSGQYLLTGAVG